MQVKSFLGGFDKNLSYLIWCQNTKLAAIIDPAVNPLPIFEYIESNDLILEKIFITHTHHDHYKYLDDFFVSSYKRKISNNFLLGYDLINMIININSDYGKYFQFGLRNEEKINTGLQSNPYYSEFNDNQNVKIYVVDNFKIIPIN